MVVAIVIDWILIQFFLILILASNKVANSHHGAHKKVRHQFFYITSRDIKDQQFLTDN